MFVFTQTYPVLPCELRHHIEHYETDLCREVRLKEGKLTQVRLVHHVRRLCEYTQGYLEAQVSLHTHYACPFQLTP